MGKIDFDKVIENDLKVFPWLKYCSFDACRLEAIYLDTYHGDLWRRFITDGNIALTYVGRLTEYNELIKDKNVQ